MFVETLRIVEISFCLLQQNLTQRLIHLATYLPSEFRLKICLKRVRDGIVRRTATISDNLGESARDMLIFPIYFPTWGYVSVKRRGAVCGRTLELNERFPRFVLISFATTRAILSLSLSLSNGIVLLLRVQRFHWFAVSPRTIPRDSVYRMYQKIKLARSCRTLYMLKFFHCL